MQPLTRQWRRIRRCSAFSVVLARGLLAYVRMAISGDLSRRRRVEWLHQVCRKTMEATGARLTVAGPIPGSGLIVSNHLSYIDIVALSATLPCAFISKAEVRRFPVIGRFARLAGTVFVNRERRADAPSKNASVIEALREGVPVVLFAEGGTTDGHRVARFHSTMLQPAIEAGGSVTPCAIAYSLKGDGSLEREVHYWGNMTLLPHLWNLLGKSAVGVHLEFGEPVSAGENRKILGAQLHRQVVQLYKRARAAVEAGPPERVAAVDTHQDVSASVDVAQADGMKENAPS